MIEDTTENITMNYKQVAENNRMKLLLFISENSVVKTKYRILLWIFHSSAFQFIFVFVFFKPMSNHAPNKMKLIIVA